MTPLATLILSLLLSHSSAGQSVFSAEPMPNCGTDPKTPTCVLKPVCEAPSPLCAPPRWSEARGAWVRAESQQTAARRFAVAAEALSEAAVYLTKCTEDGVPVESCQRVRWPEGSADLARAMATMGIWESAFREDIMAGIPPAGRGPDGEACAMQMMPDTLRTVELWLTPEQRAKMTKEELAAQVLGTDHASLRRCFEAGGRVMAQLRGVAQHSCKQRWTYSLWARYGTLGHCDTVGIFDDFAARREKTFLSFRRTVVPVWPEWFTPDLLVALAEATP